MTPAPADVQSFRARLAAVFAGELVNKATVVAAFIWLARTVDPAVYGQIEWALSMTTVFVLVADAGLATWASARIAADPSEASTLVARVGWLRLFLAVPAYLVLLVVARAYGGPAGAALAIYGIVLFLTPLFLQYLFNGLFASGWAALGQAVRGTTLLLAVLLLVRAGSSPSTVAVAELAGALALAICNLVVLRTKFDIHVRVREARRGFLSLLTKSWTLGASEVTWGVHWYVGLILLGFLATPTDAAWYSASLRLVLALHTGVYLYLYVLLPNLARLVAVDVPAWQHLVDRSMRLTGWIACTIALVGTLGAPTILTTVFGARFIAAVPALRIMIWLIPIAWMSGHVRYSLIAAQHPRRDYQAALVGAATTTVLTVLLTPTLLSMGAAVAILCGTAANAAAAIALAIGVLPRMALLRAVAWSSISCLGCLSLGALLRPSVGELMSTIVAGAALAAIAVIVERDTIVDAFQSLTGWRPEAERWAR